MPKSESHGRTSTSMNDNLTDLFLLHEQAKQARKAPTPKKVKKAYKGTVLLEKLYHYLDAENDLPSWRSDGFHASALKYMCARQEVFQRIMPRPKIARFDPHSLIIFGIGHAVHSWWQNNYLGPMGILRGEWVCTRCGASVDGFMPTDPCTVCRWAKRLVLPSGESPEYCETTCRWPGGFDAEDRDCNYCRRWGRWRYIEPRIELMLDDEIKVQQHVLVGHMDGILVIDEEEIVLDMKTIDPDFMKTLTEPRPAHRQQVTAYMKGLRAQGHKIDRALLVYIPKTGNKRVRMKEFVVEWDEALWEKTRRQLQNIIIALKNGHLPSEGPCDSAADGIKRECPYVEECFTSKYAFPKDVLESYFERLEQEQAAWAADVTKE